MINSIQTKAWDINEHNRLLTRGTLEFEVKSDSIFILKRVSREPGFGTASMRHFVQLSLQSGLGGNVTNQAAWTSHIFHLYMGMIPKDEQVFYIPTKWGLQDQQAVESLPNIITLIEKDESLTEELECDFEVIKSILSTEKGIDRKTITAQYVIDNASFIYQLEEKRLSYLTYSFIDILLSTLETTSNHARPNTESWGSINMELSNDGLQRWKKAIDANKAFVPFKRFEHLQSKMTPKQLAR